MFLTEPYIIIDKLIELNRDKRIVFIKQEIVFFNP